MAIVSMNMEPMISLGVLRGLKKHTRPPVLTGYGANVSTDELIRVYIKEFNFLVDANNGVLLELTTEEYEYVEDGYLEPCTHILPLDSPQLEFSFMGNYAKKVRLASGFKLTQEGHALLRSCRQKINDLLSLGGK